MCSRIAYFVKHLPYQRTMFSTPILTNCKGLCQLFFPCILPLHVFPVIHPSAPIGWRLLSRGGKSIYILAAMPVRPNPPRPNRGRGLWILVAETFLSWGKGGCTKSDEFLEKFQRKGGWGSFPIEKFILQILGTLNRAFWAWNWYKKSKFRV